MGRHSINTHSISKQRDAYSLTELLIVMVIVVLIMSASLPVAKRVLDENRVREASRQLNAYISMAKTRAVLTGRPCGVYFELATPLGAVDPPYVAPGPQRYIRQSTRMYMAETPPTYSGSTIGAKGRIMLWPKTAPPPQSMQFCPLVYNSGTSEYDRDSLGEMQVLYSLIDQGELFIVRFDYKGPWYRCLRGIGTNVTYPDPDSLYYLGSTIAGIATPVPPGTSQNYTCPGFSYQILRSPRRVGNPLELTGGTCVDMNYSGMGGNSNEFTLANTWMAMMFTPAGGVNGLYGDTVTGPVSPTGTLHFLIGRTAKVNDPALANAEHASNMMMFDPKKSNLADSSNLWVSVGRANGTTTTGENVPIPNWTGGYSTMAQSQYLGQARSIATGREQTGGR